MLAGIVVEGHQCLHVLDARVHFIRRPRAPAKSRDHRLRGVQSHGRMLIFYYSTGILRPSGFSDAHVRFEV